MRALPLIAFAAAGCTTTFDGWVGAPVDDASTWEPHEAAPSIPGPPPPLELTVSQIYPTETMRVTAVGMLPGEAVHVAGSTGGLGAGPCPPAMGGSCFDVVPPMGHLASAVANADGWASTTLTVPDTVPVGIDVHFQAVVLRGPGGADTTLSNVWSTRVDHQFCLANWDPVCGINGETFGNACEAAVAGWPVAQPGVCPP